MFMSGDLTLSVIDPALCSKDRCTVIYCIEHQPPPKYSLRIEQYRSWVCFSVRLMGNFFGPSNLQNLGHMNAYQISALANSSALVLLIEMADPSSLLHVVFGVVLLNALMEITMLISQWQAVYLVLRLKVHCVGQTYTRQRIAAPETRFLSALCDRFYASV